MVTLQMVVVFSTALVVSLAIIPLVAKFATAYGWLDAPDGGHDGKSHGRRVHSSPVPRLGGIGIALGFALSFFVWAEGGQLGWLLGPSLLVFAVGLADDFWQLRASLRLAVQIFAAAVAVVSGEVWLKTLVLSETFSFELPAFVGVPLAVFVVVGAINAVNMIDGLDGLAGGVVLIGVVLLSYLYFLSTGEIALLICISLPLIGAVLGFLRYNTHPASIFMGDGGSNWLGFMTGMLILIVLAGFKIDSHNPAIANFAPAVAAGKTIPLLTTLMCLAVPIFDTACVIVARARKGEHPMKADKRHFHHTLLKLGLSHSQSVAAVYFVALAAGVFGIAPIAFPHYHLAWLPYAAALALAVLFPMGLQAAANSDRMLVSGLLEARNKALDNRVRKILRIWETANRYTIYGLFFVAPMLAGSAPKNIGTAAGVAATAIASVTFLNMFGRFKNDFLQSLVLALAATVLLIANNSGQLLIEFGGMRYSVQDFYNAAFIWLAISTFSFILVTVRRNYLIVGPSDFLLVVIPLILILTPEPYRTELRLNVIGLRSLVLFAALRTMVRRHQHAMYRFNMIALAGLVFVFLSGVYGMKFVD